MNLGEILTLKFPDASFLRDIILQDDGQGPYIEEWNIKDSPQPTEKDLTQWAIELQSTYDLQKIDAARRAAYPPKEDLVVALWERIVEGKPAATDDLQAQREAVKAEFPKIDDNLNA